MFDNINVSTGSRGSDGKTAGHQFDGWSLEERNPDVIKAWMPVWEWFYRHYFRVQTDGWHHMPPEGKVLVVGSHNGGLASPDTSMFLYDWFRRFGYERLAYGLMHPSAWKTPIFAVPAAQVGALIAHPKVAIAALQKGAAVLVYPGGAEDMFRPYNQRYQIHLAGRKGFIKLALREEAPIVPIISHGAHETLIVLADFYQQVRQLHEWGFPWKLDAETGVFPLYLGLPWGVAIGPIPNFPLPVQIHTRVLAPIVFERYGRAAASDRAYVNACYEKVCTQMQLALDRLVREVSARQSSAP
ncbi:lysophospholipid acyltransferase family protein [Coleofasciculus sp. FACHB-125]|uniref:lysophospholipid acyltransferase family protein n=1 Tax=Coleofasciculus sp. FACHB-125 TaxID=2692784 RepID=UPI001F550CE3|nr:lysophospholipid acyltransferase family protein [Coleofasciculus sp. FACHB-125]